MNGDLYAGGTISGRVQRWDGSIWHSTGFASGSSSTQPIRALTVYNGSLIAAGRIGVPGSPLIGGWSGSAWFPLGTGIGPSSSSTVYALTTYGTDLIAAGSFTFAGGQSVQNIARWDGAAWHPMGPGLNSTVYSLAAYNGDLIAGGQMTSGIMRWNGASWAAMGVGLDAGTGYALATSNGELLAGGSFEGAGGLLSSCFARWSDTGRVWIATQPAAPHPPPCIGGLLSLGVSPAAHYSNVAFQWRRDGVPLQDGPAPDGSVVSGSASSQLQIDHLASTDAGPYDAVVSTACGNVVSDAASVAPCYANCDCSAAPPILNVLDFTCFLQKFAARNAYANCDASTVEPVLNVLDFSCFLQRFAAGCP